MQTMSLIDRFRKTPAPEPGGQSLGAESRQGLEVFTRDVPGQVHGRRRIARGELPLSPAVARRVLGYFRSTPGADLRPSADLAEALTPRESDVLAAIGEGLSIHETGERLGITYHTANGSIKSIYRKLGIKSRAQAAVEAQRRGLLQ